MVALDQKISHLGFIQSVISRMSNNSFLMKGWAVTLISALFALSAKDANRRFVLISYLPLVTFWVLDSYFLQEERLYRNLYNEVARDSSSVAPFSLDASGFSDPKNTWWQTFFSKTLVGFYGPILVILLLFSYFFV